MTLQNGLVEGGKAYLWTDTLLLSGETGKALGIAPKAFYGWYRPWAASLTMIGNPAYLSIAERLGKVDPETEDQLIEEAQLALMDYSADGSLGRLLLACCFDEPRLYGIASDHLMGIPFAAYSFDHYVAPAMTGSRPVTLAEMPGVIAGQVLGNHAWEGNPRLSAAPHKIGGTIVEICVAPEGVTERELVLSGKAGRALKRAVGKRDSNRRAEAA